VLAKAVHARRFSLLGRLRCVSDLAKWADACLLSSQRRRTRKRWRKLGYRFLRADLKPALAAVLAKS